MAELSSTKVYGNLSVSRDVNVSGGITITKAGAAGDSVLVIEADSNNVTESSNPYILLKQDGAAVTALIGLTGAAAQDPAGSTFTSALNNALAIHQPFATGSVDIGVNGAVGLSVRDGGDVIVTSGPLTLLDHIFTRSAQNYISLKSNDAAGVGIRLQSNEDTVRGALFANADGIGFLNAALSWAVRFDLTGEMEVGTVPWARLTSVPTSLSNTVNLTGAQSIAGTKTFTDKPWFTLAGSSGDNASRELIQFSDDRTDRYSAIGTWRGAASTRIGLSFWGSFDAAPIERMRLDDSGNLRLLTGALYTTSVTSTGALAVTTTSSSLSLTSTSGSVSMSTAASVTIGGGAGVFISHNSVLSLYTQATTVAGNTTGAKIRHHNGTNYDVGLNVLPITTEDVSDTLEAIHCGGVYFKDGTTAITLTLEASGTSDFPVGGVCTIINAGTSGTITVTEGAGTTLYVLTGSARTDSLGSSVIAAGGVATLWREATTIYYLWGSGITP